MAHTPHQPPAADNGAPHPHSTNPPTGEVPPAPVTGAAPHSRTMMVFAAAVLLLTFAITGAALAIVAGDRKTDAESAARISSAAGDGITKKTTRNETIHWNEPAAPAPAPQQRAPNCDDGNVIGTVIGGAAGGIAGSQIGKGSGQTAATIAGTLGGAYLGNEHIPTRGTLCP